MISQGAMSRTYFEFKQFTVHHDRCAMKVGTDGVLLGAWADVSEARSILDIGCGSGLVALMCAQRSSAFVTGIDIDADAVEQATENATLSPWKNRIEILQDDICHSTLNKTFDAIVCNPPFFEKSLHCPDEKRTMARHSESLPLKDLSLCASKLLNKDGTFAVIIPSTMETAFTMNVWEAGMHLFRRCLITGKVGKMAKRVLLEFKKGEGRCVEDNTLVLMNPDGSRSAEYSALTKDFYLDK